MLLAACEQFLGKTEDEIQQVALETLEGHQRAIMGSMTVEVGHNFDDNCTFFIASMNSQIFYFSILKRPCQIFHPFKCLVSRKSQILITSMDLRYTLDLTHFQG